MGSLIHCKIYFIFADNSSNIHPIFKLCSKVSVQSINTTASVQNCFSYINLCNLLIEVILSIFQIKSSNYIKPIIISVL